MNMKKSLIYILAFSAIVGCQKSEVSEQNPAEGESSAVIVGSFPETKTSFVDEGNVMKTEWVKDDALGFYWYKGGSIEGVGAGEVDKALNDRLVAESSGGSTTFKTSWYYMYQVGIGYLTYLYYPYNVNAGKNPLSVPLTVPSSQNQAGSDDIAHLSATDFLYATAMASRPNGEAEQTVMVTFNHALSVLNIVLTSAQSNYSVSDIRVRFEDESEIFSVTEGSVNLSDGSLTLTSGTPEISLHFNEAATLSATPVNAYMTITPGHAGKTFSVYATVNGIETKLGSKKVPASGLPAGVKAALSFEVGDNTTGHEYTDLSANGTANCYLVTSPGFYKFKADVKGNGIVPSQLESVAGQTAIVPKSALVLWYNCYYDGTVKDESPVFVNSVSVKDGYICFYTPSTFVSGNVVIAAFAEEGVTYENIEIDEKRNISNATMLWSWNIWAVKDYDVDSDAMTLGSYKIMGRNLGAIADGRDLNGNFEPVNAVGNFYQWGRKDPFPSFDNYDTYQPCDYTNYLLSVPTFTPIIALQINNQSNKKNVNGQMFGYAHKADGSVDTNAALNFAPKSSFASSSDKLDVYLSYATKAPYMFIGGVNKVNGGLEYSNYNWYYKSDKDQTFKALWGDSDSGTDRKIEKSLYDPCPAGWRTMGKEVIDAFVTAFNAEGAASMAANLNGVLFNGSYFPFTGYGRNYTNMKVGQSKISGYETYVMFWNASACDANSGYWYPGRLELDAPANANASSVVTSKNANDRCGAQGLAVRCVKE